MVLGLHPKPRDTGFIIFEQLEIARRINGYDAEREMGT
jgi:hypothetical protein